MVTENADDLVQFQDVTVVRSVATALLCRIGKRTVWLPRWHTSGKLWCAGDRGKLFIRRWVALDRHLIGVGGAVLEPAVAPSRLPGALRLVRREGSAPHGG
jgi:hypothetical protein